ncbi:UNVERIFIED_CONTAM: MarR family transcriptional regulator [Kocuria sp. CPCC 205274]
MDSVTEEAQRPRVEEFERGRVEAPEVSWALRALLRAAAEVDQQLAHRLRLRPLDYSAMNHLMSSEDRLGAAELSGRLGISTGSATELVDRLEQAGHLERRAHPSDRRRKVLAPTDAALGATLGALQPLFERLDGLVETFSPEEQAVIERYLRAATGHFLDFAHEPPAREHPAPGTSKDPAP